MMRNPVIITKAWIPACSGMTKKVLSTAFLVALLLFFSDPSGAADMALKDVLPVPGFTAGWTLDGSVELYDKDNLFNHINGEAELYFPYGFELLASGHYVSDKNSALSLVADVYQMGSGLDAFGIYSNYRKATSAGIAVGAEGFVSATQLLFYQDRYFIRLQVTGDTDMPEGVLPALARAVSAKLPPGFGPPREINAVQIAALVPRSERYLAKSLLGYAFFRHGIIADAVLHNERMQLISIHEKSAAAAGATLDQYATYLKAEGQETKLSVSAVRRRISAVDPLYGRVLMEQAGPYLIGVIRIKNEGAAGLVLEQLQKQIAADSGD